MSKFKIRLIRLIMQKLDFIADGFNQHREYVIPDDTIPVEFNVSDRDGGVVLAIDMIDAHEVFLTVEGARDLALALRKSANCAERKKGK